MRYLARLRIARAIEDLLGGRLSLAVIAERVGYASEVPFAKAFKRHVGVGPGAFRKHGASRTPAETTAPAKGGTRQDARCGPEGNGHDLC
jgi:AraC family transcriptional regulator, activator of mtrCDE